MPHRLASTPRPACASTVTASASACVITSSRCGSSKHRPRLCPRCVAKRLARWGDCCSTACRTSKLQAVGTAWGLGPCGSLGPTVSVCSRQCCAGALLCVFQGVKAASSTPDCRAQYGTGVSAMKDTTMRRVKCNAITKLARNVIPNYPFQGSPKTDGSANIGGAGLNGFQVTMDGIPRFLKAVSYVGSSASFHNLH